MNLKNFLINRDVEPELYWSIVIEEGWVQAGIWMIKESNAEVIGQSPPTAWEVEEELVGVTDAALSAAAQKISENFKEPEKTVFGVPSFWVKEGEISEEHLGKIKKICTQLSLNPVGFVVLPEAIAHLYKSEEGTPVSAIIVGLSKEYAEISVFKLGELIGTSKVARSISLIEDVTEGLSRFEGSSPLPSRFIVFDGKGGELEEAKENLMQASWDELPKIKFLHTPKVEIFTSDKKVIATSLAGANEIAHVSSVTVATTEEQTTKDEAPANIENFTHADGVDPRDLGFAVGEDITLNRPTVEEKHEEIKKSDPAGFEVHGPSALSPSLHPDGISGYVEKTKGIFKRFSNRLKAGYPESVAVKKGSLLIIGVLLLLLLAGSLLAWWFLPKAKITIYVLPKGFQDSLDVTFNKDGQSDLGLGIIPAEVRSVEVLGNKTKSATGSKLIGDKSKGSVQIANGNSSPIELVSGTMLVSSSGLKFVTNSDASVSGQLLPGSPGTATVEVTAADIGDQYNLAKGEVYRVGNYSKALVAGTSTSDFTGGSSRQISAVSEEDHENIFNQLMEELTEDARRDLTEGINENVILADDLALVEPIEETYDKKVGEEADSVKLSMRIKAEGVFIDEEKLLEYARGVLREKIPSGYVLKDSQISFKFTYVDSNESGLNFKVAISANFLPEVNADNIIKQVSGRTTEVAENYLGFIPGFSRAEVKFRYNLPGPLKILPKVAKNIEIEVLPEE